jgi:prophage tail gpP-like protein
MDENLTIRLGGEEVIDITSYSVRLGIFEQPGSFTCTIGRPYKFRALAERFPPKTKYEVFLNGRCIQIGLTDGFRQATSHSKTEIVLSGRDPLQKLVDTEIHEKQSFTEVTYRQLVEMAIEKSGLNAMVDRFGVAKFLLFALNNAANRKAITGSHTIEELSDGDIESVEQDVGPGNTPTSRTVRNSIRVDVGERWWDFVVKQLRRVGLFLWCGADGTLVLASPNVTQSALYRLVRTDEFANIEDHSFDNDTTQRHSECRVYGATSAGKDGTDIFDAQFIDDEMVSYLNPLEADRANGGKITLVKSIRDSECKSKEQAQNLARREIAEERRAGWRLSYTIKGHSLPEINANADITVMPDTVLDVQDDDLGVYGPLYVEGVTLTGQGNETRTEIQVLRLEDVFFQNERASSSKQATGEKLRPVGINVQRRDGVFIPGIGTDLFGDAPGLDKNWRQPSNKDPFASLPDLRSELHGVNQQSSQIYTRKGRNDA